MASDVPILAERARYLSVGHVQLAAGHDSAGESRFTVWVDHEDALLADTAVSAVIETTDGVPMGV